MMRRVIKASCGDDGLNVNATIVVTSTCLSDLELQKVVRTLKARFAGVMTTLPYSDIMAHEVRFLKP